MKNDVYTFGITLLETVSSFCRSKPRHLHRWVRIRIHTHWFIWSYILTFHWWNNKVFFTSFVRLVRLGKQVQRKVDYDPVRFEWSGKKTWPGGMTAPPFFIKKKPCGNRPRKTPRTLDFASEGDFIVRHAGFEPGWAAFSAGTLTNWAIAQCA